MTVVQVSAASRGVKNVDGKLQNSNSDIWGNPDPGSLSDSDGSTIPFAHPAFSTSRLKLPAFLQPGLLGAELLETRGKNIY